jgi:hypothetical protein
MDLLIKEYMKKKEKKKGRKVPGGKPKTCKCAVPKK